MLESNSIIYPSDIIDAYIDVEDYLKMLALPINFTIRDFSDFIYHNIPNHRIDNIEEQLIKMNESNEDSDDNWELV